MVQVARAHGVGPLRQALEIRRLGRGETQLVASEYYAFQLYRPTLDVAEKREFVGEKGSYELNLKLSPPGLTNLRGFLSDKVALTGLYRAWGLPTTETQAVFHPNRRLGTLPVLQNAADIRDFLLTRARYPLFGKPVAGAQAQGSARFVGIEGDSMRLANGTSVPLDRLVAEIAAHSAVGYVFQTAIDPHPALKAMTGSDATSTVRVVTVIEDNSPRVLYTLGKLASPTAMSDNFWQAGSLISLLDPANGRMEKVRHGSGLATQWPTHHPVTGAPLVGETLPHWQAVVDLAIAAHAAFPVNGILGWDIAITETGPVLIECNENTGHALYQLAADRGVLNADFRPAFDRIIARNTAALTAFSDKKKAYLKARASFN